MECHKETEGISLLQRAGGELGLNAPSQAAQKIH